MQTGECVMAVAGNYVVVSDDKRRLKKGQSFNVNCPIPDNIAKNWAPVLTFMVDSVGSLDGFKFHVDFFPSSPTAPTNVYNGIYSGRHYHSVQEVLPGNLINSGGNFQFDFDGGDGELDISDIVVWIRVDV
jgi:hypothetical protein